MNGRNTDGMILNKIGNLKDETISKTAMIGSAVWLISPLAAMVMNVIDIDGSYTRYGIWITFLYVAGCIGWLCGLALITKRCIHLKLSNREIVKDLIPLLLFFAFFIWCIVCTCFSLEKIVAIYGIAGMRDNLITYFFYGGMILSGLAISINKRHTIDLCRIFIFISLFMTIIALLNNGVTDLLCKNPTTNTLGYESVFYNTNHYGYYLVIVIVLSGFLMIYLSNIFDVILNLVTFALSTFVLILNNTMGSYLAVLLGLFFATVWCFMIKHYKKHRVCLLLLLFIILSVISLSFSPNVKNNFMSLFFDVSILNTETAGSAGSGRISLWKDALAIIKFKPIVGVGPQNSLQSYHNLFLQLAVYNGIPGLILYCSPYVVGVKRLYVDRKNVTSTILISSFVVISYLISAFFGVTMFYVAPFYYLALGFCVRGSISMLKAADN